MVQRICSATAVGLASLVLVSPAAAQMPAETPAAPESTTAATPTPSATPTVTPVPTLDGDALEEGVVGAPPEDAPRRVRRVYRDFRRDALIEPCDHTLNTLRDTRDSVSDEFAEEFPDFLASVNAAIDERKELDCKALAEQEAAERKAAERKASEEDARDEDAANGSGGTAASTDTGAGAAASPATPAAPLPIDPLPAEPGSTEDELAPDPLPPVETPAPLPEAVPPPAPPAAPAPPAPAPPPGAAVSAEPAAAPAPVYGLAAGGGLLALAGLMAPLLGARGGSRLAAFQHSWAEAGYRVRGTWQDFRDWLRVGR